MKLVCKYYGRPDLLKYNSEKRKFEEVNVQLDTSNPIILNVADDCIDVYEIEMGVQ